MSVMELVQSVQYVVDKRGHRKSVQLDYPIWEEILTLLEDIEDAEELEEAEEEEDTLVPWEQVVADYKKNHSEVNHV